MRDKKFSSVPSKVNLYPNQGTHWVGVVEKNYFDAHGCATPKNILENIKAGHGKCIYSEYQSRKNASHYGS